MHHVVLVDLLDVPEIQGVVRTEEMMTRAFLPPVEGELKTAHEVFSSENWVHFLPDDCLGEIQAAGLQHRRVVAEIGVPSPYVESPAGLEHTRHVSKPSMQTLVELGFRQVV